MSRTGLRVKLGLAAKLGLALLLAGGASAAATADPRPAATQWAARTSATADGAFVLGNPAAKVRLVEYISYTCSHCAHYAADASAPLKKRYVAGGQVAVEFRHAVRDAFDLTAALLARCGGPSRFFDNSEAILAAQADWMEKGQANPPATRPASIDEGVRVLARNSGLEAMMRTRGYSAQQIDACLTDAAQQQQLMAMTQAALEKISGTPSFELNGTLLDDVHSWAQLEPRLKAALQR